jgi:arachidonate 15-lipoxygenase
MDSKEAVDLLMGDGEGIVEATLPQKNGIKQKLLRMAEMKVRQSILQFKMFDDDPDKAPEDRFLLPLSDMGPKLLLRELNILKPWVEGQIENRLTLLANEALWKSIQKLQNRSQQMEAMSGVLNEVKNSEKYKDNTVSDDVLGMFSKMETPATQTVLDEVGFEKFETFSAYCNSYAILDAPEISGKWQDDKVFASQRLAGLNPMAIQRVTLDGDEPGVGVSWDKLKAKLSSKINGDSLAYFGLDLDLTEAIKQRRLYVCDYKALASIKPDKKAAGVKQSKMLAPIALYVRTDRFSGLQLLAIQLDQASSSDALLAKDKNSPGKANNWIMAKMIVQVSDVNYNQSVNHLLETHLIEDAMATATRRQLHVEHPLRVLLTQHFTALLVINKGGEKLLLSDKGLLQQVLETGLSGALQLMKERYDTWTFEDLDFPERLKSRGVDDNAALPYFPYRDDGLLLWDVLGRYVEAYLNNYYQSDTDVQEDYELQAWAVELSEKVKGFSSNIDSISSLKTILQRIIWTAGPQHASVNFPQIEYFGFVPNYPTAFYTHPPENLSSAIVSNEELLAFLPPAEKAAAQIEVAIALSGYHYDSLLDYYEKLEPSAAEICKQFYDELRGPVSKEINKRNRQREEHRGLLAYPYFLPENVPNSTSV